MKIVTQIEMDGPKPYGPLTWDGIGKHPLLGMTIEEIRAHAKASAVNYKAPAHSDVSIKAMAAEQEEIYMTDIASERAKDAAQKINSLASAVSQLARLNAVTEVPSESYTG